MFKNYLMVAIRSILRRRTYAFINVFGLSLGVAIVLLIYTFLRYDLTYDSFYDNSDRIYRAIVAHDIPTDGDKENRRRVYNGGISAKFKPEIDDKVAGIEKLVRHSEDEVILRKDEALFHESLLFADPELFDVFDFNITSGVNGSLIPDKNSAVVSRSFAEKYYPDQKLIGQEIELQVSNEYKMYKVTAIVEDMPENCSQTANVIIDFQILYDTVIKTFGDTWGLTFSTTFVLLEENAAPEAVSAGITDYLNGIDAYVDNEGEHHSAVKLQQITKRHIDLNNVHDYPTRTDAGQFWILAAIGFILVLIATINFTTLSIGSSSYRASEVGVRKVLGGDKSQICIQFWIETALITLFSILIGYAFAELLLPAFSNFVERELPLSLSKDVLLFLGILWLLVTSFAGTYPGLVISGFNPVEAMRGSIKIGGKRKLRKVLVFVQFAVSIFLISATLIMKQQMSYIQSKTLGFNKDQVVLFPVPNNDRSGEEAVKKIRTALAENPSIMAVSGLSCNFKKNWSMFDWDSPEGQEFRDISENNVDYEFLNVMQLELIEGEGFTEKIGEGAIHQIVINESMKKELGFENAVGQHLPGSHETHEIVGVVKDFHFENMKNKIKPLVMTDYPWLLFAGNSGCTSSNWYTIQNIVVRIAPEKLQSTMKHIEKVWPEVLPDFVYDYTFVDEQVDMQYKEDRRWNQIVSVSSMVAIIIAILGLLGLSTLEVAQRTKEIGIRKVLGASSQAIIVLLSKEISRLILIASLAAWCVAWFTMNKWLENFVYRVNMNPILLFLAGCGAFLIAIATVTLLSYRIAHSNPVNSLRDE